MNLRECQACLNWEQGPNEPGWQEQLLGQTTGWVYPACVRKEAIREVPVQPPLSPQALPKKRSGLTQIAVALGVTFLLGIVLVFASAVTDSPLSGLLIVLATASWAAVDSHRLELKKYRCGLDHPIGVFFCVGMLWIVFLPVYLIVRSRCLGGELPLKKQFAGPSYGGGAVADPTGPPVWVRVILIGSFWLPVSVFVTIFVPRFEPILQHLAEREQLPELTRWVLAFLWLDRAGFHLPMTLFVLVPLGVTEGVVMLRGRRSWAALWLWMWVLAVALLSIPATLLIVVALLLAVFKVSSDIG